MKNKILRVYLSHNMFGLDNGDVLRNRKEAQEKLEKEGFHCLWLYDMNDFKRNLLPEEIVGRCFGILSAANIFIMLDADIPGWGKMVEMYQAYLNETPIFCIWQKEGRINDWIYHYSTEIFSNMENCIKYLVNEYGYLKENYGN